MMKMDLTNNQIKHCKYCNSPIILDKNLCMWININANGSHTTKNNTVPSDMNCLYKGVVKTHKP
jgi:hypothetical protein